MDILRRSSIVTLLFLPMAISAQELTLGADVEGAYDTNVFGVQSNEVDDFSFRITPNALLEDHEGELRWELEYRPYFDYFIDTHEARGWNQLASGKLSWQVDPATRVELSDRFGYFRSVSQFNEVVTLGEGDQVVDVTQVAFGLNRNTRNTAGASLTHSLSPTRMLVFDLGHNLVDYSRDESPDRQTVAATGRYLQTVTRRNTVGGGVSFQRSSFDSTPFRKSQATNFYNLFGSWEHRFDETLELNVAAGPTWVDTDRPDDVVIGVQDAFLYPMVSYQGKTRLVKAASCPSEDGVLILTGECDVIGTDLTPFDQSFLGSFRTNLMLEGSVPSGSSSSLTYFANVTLSKRWEQWSGALSYRRQQADSSGVGTSNVADILSGILDWKPSPRWHATLRVAYTRQSQATDAIRTAVAVRPAAVFAGTVYEGAAESFALKAVKIDQNVQVDTLWVRLRVRYRLTKRSALYGMAVYWDQSTDGGSGVGFDYDRFRVSFGVEYRFDPIRL